jgi:hypothetical protein
MRIDGFQLIFGESDRSFMASVLKSDAVSRV